MKIPFLFGKPPKYKRFNFTPRHYDPIAEEMAARKKKIEEELRAKGGNESQAEISSHRQRIAGSFKAAQRRSKSFDPSVNLLRLLILLFLTLLLIAMFQFGARALYGSVLLVPFYFYLKYRTWKKPPQNP